MISSRVAQNTSESPRAFFLLGSFCMFLVMRNLHVFFVGSNFLLKYS